MNERKHQIFFSNDNSSYRPTPRCWASSGDAAGLFPDLEAPALEMGGKQALAALLQLIQSRTSLLEACALLVLSSLARLDVP
jgi:hypothetical protein